jgi:spore maturation protein CgeB
MTSPLSFVIFGLSITSSWGNGHATTYRALVRELTRRGHQVTFFERSVPWYRDNADLPNPEYCHTILYRSPQELSQYASVVRRADVVIVGSYVLDGAEVAAWALEHCRGLSAFYDIDTPVTVAALRQRQCEYLTPALVPRFDLYLSFAGGPILDILKSELGARRVEPLYCSVDTELYRPLSLEPLWDLGYLGTYSADRQPQLTRLLLEPATRQPQQAFAVAGSLYPEDIRWPPNVERIEHVAPGDHAKFYSRQRWTLNLTRSAMIDAGHSPSVRLFEAAACGVPIMSDRSAGLARFFEPGTELLLVDSAEDVLGLLQSYSAAEREAMGQRARRRILHEHTAAHRVSQLEDYLHSARQRRSPSSVSMTTPTAEQSS